ncbi:hypothetical protein [Oceanithermus sp.]
MLPERVYLQSFDLADIRFWRRYAPDHAANAVWLDGRYKQRNFDPAHPERLKPTMAELAAEGLRYLSPPLWVLLGLDKAAAQFPRPTPARPARRGSS